MRRSTNHEPRTKKLKHGSWSVVRGAILVLFLGAWCVARGSLSAQGAERIVSLNACTDELLLQLADPAQIAGVTHFTHSPQSEAVLKSHPEILKLSGDAERIYKSRPSVVVAGPFSNPQTIEQLKKLKIEISIFKDPISWEDLLRTVKALEEMLGTNPQIALFRRNILNLNGPQSKWAGKRALFWSPAGHVPGRGTFENTILETLGMQNAVDFENYAFLSLEKLIQLQPEVIVVTQNPKQRNSWAHDTLFHPALRAALPRLEYLHIPEEAVSCASAYTVEILEKLLNKTPGAARTHPRD